MFNRDYNKYVPDDYRKALEARMRAKAENNVPDVTSVHVTGTTPTPTPAPTPAPASAPTPTPTPTPEELLALEMEQKARTMETYQSVNLPKTRSATNNAQTSTTTSEKITYSVDHPWISKLPQSFIDEYLIPTYNADGSVKEYTCRPPYSHFNLEKWETENYNSESESNGLYSYSLDCTVSISLCFDNDGTAKDVKYYTQCDIDNYLVGDWWRLTDKYINEYLIYDEQSNLYRLKSGKSFEALLAEKENFVDERIVYQAKDISPWISQSILDEYLIPKSYHYSDGSVTEYFLKPEYTDFKVVCDVEQEFEDETLVNIAYRVETTDKNGNIQTKDYYRIGSLGKYLVPPWARLAEDKNVNWWRGYVDEFFEYDKTLPEYARLYTLKDGKTLQELKALSPYLN